MYIDVLYIWVYVCVCVDLAPFGSTQNNTNQLKSKCSSNLLPEKLPSYVETFITCVNDDIKSSKT